MNATERQLIEFAIAGLTRLLADTPANDDTPSRLHPDAAPTREVVVGLEPDDRHRVLVALADMHADDRYGMLSIVVE